MKRRGQQEEQKHRQERLEQLKGSISAEEEGGGERRGELEERKTVSMSSVPVPSARPTPPPHDDTAPDPGAPQRQHNTRAAL